MSASEEPIPLLDLAAQNDPLAGELRAAFERVLSHGQFILGPEVEALEAALCEQLGFAHAVGVSSGTDALLLSLMCLGVGPGDEVITTPFSFFATAGCIQRVGAQPVFADIDPETFNLDPGQVAGAITARTRAILPVHLYGRAAPMAPLMDLAQRHGLAIVEDAAQALGARTQQGAGVGTLGALGCFSFFPSKNLGGFGDGGLVTCRDAELLERARVLRSHGGSPKYFHAVVGGNFRLDALQAALLSVKLPHLARYTAARRAHAARYDALFADAALPVERLRTPALTEGHVVNQYVIRSDRRDRLREALAEAGIASAIYYPVPLHLQRCFAPLGYRAGDLPEAERACREVLALPLYPELRESQLLRVVDAVVKVLREP